jgi:hypothetical protein
LDRKLVEGLDHIAAMSGFDPSPLGPVVAQQLWEMCFHFIGPHEVAMNRRGEAYVLSCI